MKGIKSIEADELRKKWIKYPQYIIVGHNPHLEIQKVFNLSVSRGENGNEVLEWDCPLVDGGVKREKYECSNDNL